MPRVADNVCIDCRCVIPEGERKYRHRCAACWRKPPTEAKCMECNEIVPVSEFGAMGVIGSLNGGGPYETVCICCEVEKKPKEPSIAVCMRCEREVRRSDFGNKAKLGMLKDGSGRFTTICAECEAEPPTSAFCIKCKTNVQRSKFGIRGVISTSRHGQSTTICVYCEDKDM